MKRHMEDDEDYLMPYRNYGEVNGYKNDFGYLGDMYQFRLVKALMEDKAFYGKLIPFVDQNCFTVTELRMIVGITKDWFHKYGYIPSWDTLEIELRDRLSSMTLATREMHMTTYWQCRNDISEGVDETKNKAIKFFKQQSYVKIFNENMNLIREGKDIQIDVVEKKLQSVSSIGKLSSNWCSIYDDLEDTLSKEKEVRIPLGVPEIDSYLDGGFIKGNLLLIAAGAGIGKTTVCTALAQNAALHDQKVLQIFFEDRVRSIKRKHFGKITGVEAVDINSSLFSDVDGYENKQKLIDNIRIGKFPAGQLTVGQLRQEIARVIDSGFVPDVIIFDYFECVLNSRLTAKETDWEAQSHKMREFENMAFELNVLVAVSTQGTKETAQGMLINLDKISGSAGKSQVAHAVMTINRSEQDKEENRAIIFFPKFREGRSGRSFNVLFNNGTCRISVERIFKSEKEYNEMIRQTASTREIDRLISKTPIPDFPDVPLSESDYEPPPFRKTYTHVYVPPVAKTPEKKEPLKKREYKREEPPEEEDDPLPGSADTELLPQNEMKAEMENAEPEISLPPEDSPVMENIKIEISTRVEDEPVKENMKLKLLPTVAIYHPGEDEDDDRDTPVFFPEEETCEVVDSSTWDAMSDDEKNRYSDVHIVKWWKLNLDGWECTDGRWDFLDGGWVCGDDRWDMTYYGWKSRKWLDDGRDLPPPTGFANVPYPDLSKAEKRFVPPPPLQHILGISCIFPPMVSSMDEVELAEWLASHWEYPPPPESVIGTDEEYRRIMMEGIARNCSTS
jgi:hypothetical protein